MTQLLFVGEHQQTAQQLAPFLPATVGWICIDKVAQVVNYLCPKTELPALILLEAADDNNLTEQCHSLKQNQTTADLPIITILTHPHQRELVLAAGATDYIFRPFVAQEVKNRLSPYVQPVMNQDTFFLTALQQVDQGVLSWSWLYKNLAPLVETMLGRKATLWLESDQQRNRQNDAPTAAATPDDALSAYLSQNPILPHNQIVYLGNPPQPVLLIPLATAQRLKGVLAIGYEQSPVLTTPEETRLTLLGKFVAYLLEIADLHDEVQSYATQTAFMILVAKIINEQLDLNNILALTLEHVATILQTTRGEIWLLDTENRTLSLVSELTTSFTHYPVAKRPVGAGLIGWVAKHNKTLNVSSAAATLDPSYDLIAGNGAYQLLAVPLYHHDLIGVLAVYAPAQNPFSIAQQILLEGIARLVTSAITNAQLVKELRDFARQQYVLYEMSQQLASGLDLQVCLNHAMGWATRLCQVEVGMLWLVNDSNELELVTTYGVERLPNITLSTDDCFIGEAVLQGQSRISNNPAPSEPYDHNRLFKLFDLNLRNIIAIPMIYHGISIGALSLINKLGNDFDVNDLKLLTTAVEMIAVAIGNAHLYARTVALIDERERLHQQVIQTERLATVGRLTASLSHEINNPMQAIKGAMTLALEDLNDIPSLREYIQLTLEQSNRVVQLVNRMKEIYRPHNNAPEWVNITHLLQEILIVVHKAISRQNVAVRTRLATHLPLVFGVANQLHLVFLSIALNLSDALGSQGGEIWLVTKGLPDFIQVQFITPAAHLPLPSFHLAPGETMTEASFGLSFCHDIVQAHGGSLHITPQNGQVLFTIALPTTRH